MKILWLAKGGRSGQDSDHQCDHLFIGMRNLLGSDIVDFPRAWRAYAADYPNGGKAYTFGGVLGDDNNVDRTDIPAKIALRYFDYVFYGAVNRDRSLQSEVLAAYPRNRIVLIDGEDDQDLIYPEVDMGCRYFKRELAAPYPGVLPIHFAMPSSKIWEGIPPKVRQWALVDPYDKSTYINSSEYDYYKQYAESFFGRTMKRGGWDCLRHYEIIAAGALPYFDNLENCPPLTMFQMPKAELLRARELCDTWGSGKENEYHELLSIVRGVLKDKLTAESLARYVLDTVR